MDVLSDCSYTNLKDSRLWLVDSTIFKVEVIEYSIELYFYKSKLINQYARQKWQG